MFATRVYGKSILLHFLEARENECLKNNDIVKVILFNTLYMYILYNLP